MQPHELYPRPYEIRAPAAWHAPAIFNSPHSGRLYSSAFLTQTRLNPVAIRRSEDCYVDELFASALHFGAPLLMLHAPRAYIDVNREPYELDQRMFAETLPPYVNNASVRVVNGLGTIPRIVSEGEEIYRAPLTLADALGRIESIYRPYHHALATLVDKAQRAFGTMLLVDCHSMPSSSASRSQRFPDIVLGDRHGSACDPAVSDLAEQLFTQQGLRVVRNKPYAGGFITQNYASPALGRHTLQIEINRALYLNERTMEKTRGFATLSTAIEAVIGGLLMGATELFAPARLAAE